MINGNIINGNTINGNAGIDLFSNPFDSLSIYETVNLSMNYGLVQNELVQISEEVLIYFDKGLPQTEGLKISENVIVDIGTLFLNISDDPIEISETVTYNLQKGILMQDYIKYYLDLLIIQYKNKSKALAHMTTLISVCLIDLLPLILNDKFNLDTAEGVQLDILGKYIGITRRVKTFGSDVTLSDDEYRILLKIKRSTNTLNGSLQNIDQFIYGSLNGILNVFDHQNMGMSYILNSSVISNTLAQAIIEQDILPKPMAVSMSSIIYLPNLENIFGFRSYTFNEGTQVGFNSYSNFNSSYQFLSYEDTI